MSGLNITHRPPVEGAIGIHTINVRVSKVVADHEKLRTTSKPTIIGLVLINSVLRKLKFSKNVLLKLYFSMKKIERFG